MSEANNCFIEFNNVTLQNEATILLNSLSFKVFTGEWLVVAGGDISGKSLLLKLCVGLVQPTQGDIFIKGRKIGIFSYRELQRFRHKTGFVFQEAVLVSNLSIRENIAFPLKYYSNLTGAEINKSTEKYLESLGLKMYADERPAGLPKEIKLLANLGRALVTEPELLLVDELFTDLSTDTIKTVIELLRNIRNKHCLTCIFTTSMIDLISAFPEGELADNLMLIESGNITSCGDCRIIRESVIQRQR